MNEKLKKIIYMVLGVFVIIFFLLFLVSSCSSKMDPETFETKIMEKAKSYYSTHKDELPSLNGIVSLSLNDLTVKGIIKDPEKMLKKNTNCSGTLYIENNNNYYSYSPILNCTTPTDTYKSSNLKDTIISKEVTSGNGLYSIGNEYYFRGDKVDNYLVFDKRKWRITKINEDGTIRLIEDGRRDPVVWDDRYNEEVGASIGKNNYVKDGINSRIKDTLDDIYKNDSVLSEDGKAYIKETTLCIGKRSLEETVNDGSIECSQTLDNQYLGLLQLNEYLLASLDTSCKNADEVTCSNYNYLADFENSYWTLTGNSANTSQVYKINSTIMSTGANNTGMARLVINISEHTNVRGNGTEKDPYVIVGFKNEIKK